MAIAYLCVSFKARPQSSHETDSQAPSAAAVIERERPARLEGIADGPYTAAFGDL
jgi:hypothetical protein